MKAKLEKAISSLKSDIDVACSTFQQIVEAQIKNIAKNADPVQRTKNLMEMLHSLASSTSQTKLESWTPTENRHHPRYRSLSDSSPDPQVDLLNKLAALEVLERLLQKFENDPGAELSYEFNVSRLGDDYIGGRDVAEPIDVSHIGGSTRYLLRVLSYVNATIEWPTRCSGLKASFIITN